MLNSVSEDEMIGKLIGFFDDDNIEEVMHNGGSGCIKIYHAVYGMCDTNVKLTHEEAIDIVKRIASFNGRDISSANPMLDGSLPDGSRVNLVVPPVSVDGSAITIRKFKKRVITASELVNFGTMNPEVCAFLWCCVDGLGYNPANIMFAGGTSSGKTTLLNALSMFVPAKSRIIVIEDTPELKILSTNLVRLETSSDPPVDMDRLLKNMLRMRPDRIIVGEVRGPECRTLFTAMNTGHNGCMGTIHANTARETLEKVTNPPMDVPSVMLKALDLIVMEQRVNVGGKVTRIITEISEIGGVEGDVSRLNTIYTFDQNKKVLRRTGVPSKIRTKISEAAGISPKQFDEILARRVAVIERLMRERPDADGFLRAVAADGRV